MKEKTLGIDCRMEQGYRTMLTRSRWRVHEFAEGMGTDIDEARGLVEDMSVAGLAMRSVVDDAGVRAVQPGVALRALAARRHRGKAQIEEFVSWHEKMASRLDDSDEVLSAVERLVGRVCDEVVLLAPGYVPGGYEFAEHVAEAALRRGAAMRVVWGPDVSEVRAAARFASWLSGRGVVVRAADVVPVRAVIVDGQASVVMAGPGAGRVVRSPSQMAGLTELAGRLWREGSDVRGSTACGLTQSRYQVVLRLMADGLSDEAVAQRLGLSVRTVRGDIAAAMTELEAKSRFQAAVMATRRGLL